MKPGYVSVHLIRPGTLPDDTARSHLTAGEIARAGRFHFRNDAEEWISCRAQLRMLLGGILGIPPLEVPLWTAKSGKPLLSAPYHWLHFNLSHCPGLALVALSQEGPVGVDVEPLSRMDGLVECENSFCHPLEIRSLPEALPARARQLMEIWTAKEAVLKALGVGLLQAPESVRIIFEGSAGVADCDHPLAGLENQRIHPLAHPSMSAFRGVLSAPKSVAEIEILELKLNP